MADTIPAEEQANYEIFRECMSEPVLRALAAPVEEEKKTKKKRHAKKGSKSARRDVVDEAQEKQKPSVTTTSEEASDAEDLSEFIDVRTHLIPPSFRVFTNTLPVSQHTPLPLAPRPPPHPHPLDPQGLLRPHIHLLAPPLRHHINQPPLPHPPHRNPNSRIHLPPPPILRPHRPRLPPNPHLHVLHQRGHRPSTALEHHAPIRLRTLRPRLDTVDVPPLDTQVYA